MDEKKDMARKNVLLFWVIVFSVVIYGCGERRVADVDEAVLDVVPAGSYDIARPAASGGVVLVIESTPITADEIIFPIKEQLSALAEGSDYVNFRAKARQMLADVLMQKVTDIKLYAKAKKALPEHIGDDFIDNVVDQEVQKFIAKHEGNYARAEETLKKSGLSWEGFREETKRSILVQSFISEEVKVEKPLTYSELFDYYELLKDEYTKEDLIQFSLIDIEAGRFADANTGAESAKIKAFAYAEDLAGELGAGADFAEIAKRHSDGYMAREGGLWEPVRPGSLAEPYDEIEKSARGMYVGQISGPIAVGGHVFIFKLERKQDSEVVPFEQVQEEIEIRLRMENNKRKVNEMINKVISKVDMSYAEDFIEFCTQQAYVSF